MGATVIQRKQVQPWIETPSHTPENSITDERNLLLLRNKSENGVRCARSCRCPLVIAIQLQSSPGSTIIGGT